MAMLRRRTSDNKVAVRKAAILALEVLSNIREDSIDIEVSNIISVLSYATVSTVRYVLLCMYNLLIVN